MKIQHLLFSAVALGDLFAAVNPAFAQDRTLTGATNFRHREVLMEVRNNQQYSGACHL